MTQDFLTVIMKIRAILIASAAMITISMMMSRLSGYDYENFDLKHPEAGNKTAADGNGKSFKSAHLINFSIPAQGNGNGKR